MEKKEVTIEQYAQVLDEHKHEVYDISIAAWQMPILHGLIVTAAGYPDSRETGGARKEFIAQIRWWCREKFAEWGFTPEEVEYLDTQERDKPFCTACGGYHEPDPEDSYVDFEGYRYHPPFRCMCCGKEICARQFAFGRCCRPCDTGACQTHHRNFQISVAHEHPEWWSLDALEYRRKFAEVVGAGPSPH